MKEDKINISHLFTEEDIKKLKMAKDNLVPPIFMLIKRNKSVVEMIDCNILNHKEVKWPSGTIFTDHTRTEPINKKIPGQRIIHILYESVPLETFQRLLDTKEITFYIKK